MSYWMGTHSVPKFYQTWCRCPTTVVKQKWMSHLYQHACDQKRWKEAALDKMEVKFTHLNFNCTALPRGNWSNCLKWNQSLGKKGIFQVLSPDTKTGGGRSVGRTRSKLLLHYNETKIWNALPLFDPGLVIHIKQHMSTNQSEILLSVIAS